MRVSFVVIGLNEARHLAGSIASCSRQGFARDEIQIIYVDSGSTDGSIEIAEKAGADVVLELDSAVRNAARARNLGLTAVEAEFVQFVDGDTHLAPGWLEDALAILEADPGLAGAEGDLREARPAANLYHAVCEFDWPSVPGQAPFVSGNSVYRVDAIRAVAGFDPRMHVGEEPELGARMRAEGWRFVHLDRLMGTHDLDMDGLRDWLRQSYKSGLSCAMVARATGGWWSGYWSERLRKSLLQALLLFGPFPLAALLLPFSPKAAATSLLLGAVLLGSLVALKALRLPAADLPLRIRIAVGLHIYLGRLPAAVGMLAAYVRGLPAGDP